MRPGLDQEAAADTGEVGQDAELSSVSFCSLYASKFDIGMRCRATGISLLFHVENRQQDTLFPIIEDHIEPGAVILSDMFATYVNPRNLNSHLNQLGFRHYFINHSLHYVDPFQNWLHTNTIENTWRYLKESISHVKRHVRAEHIDGYLSVFMMRSSTTKNEFPFLMLEIIGKITTDLYLNDLFFHIHIRT